VGYAAAAEHSGDGGALAAGAAGAEGAAGAAGNPCADAAAWPRWVAERPTPRGYFSLTAVQPGDGATAAGVAMFGGEVLPLQQLQQPALKRGGAGHANCGRPGDERYDYDYEVVNCTEPSKVEALVTAAGLEWSEVDELSEEDVSTTRAASRGPCVAQSHQGVRGRRESGLGHAAATCYRGGVPGRAAYGCVPVEASSGELLRAQWNTRHSSTAWGRSGTKGLWRAAVHGCALGVGPWACRHADERARDPVVSACCGDGRAVKRET